jgi:hypothetical protein
MRLKTAVSGQGAVVVDRLSLRVARGERVALETE